MLHFLYFLIIFLHGISREAYKKKYEYTSSSSLRKIKMRMIRVFSSILLSYVFFAYCLCAQGQAVCSFKKLTVLTAPIGSAEGWTHYSLTRSIKNGLAKIGVNFNYNPSRLEDVGDVVYVLSDMNALRQAIDLRRSGKIKRLLAGPCLATRANECNHILASPEIDIYLVNSEWTKAAYIEDEPSLKKNIDILYAGIDIDFWMSVKEKDLANKNVLVYWKTEDESFCVAVENELRNCGWSPMRLRYGNYSVSQYKQVLSEVAFAVFISRSESQGLALAEAWAMDVPTLVWDPQQPLVIAGRSHWPVSAAPYLTQYTGMFWRDIEEFKKKLSHVQDELSSFSPRAWALNNMSDEASARLLLEIIHKNF